MANQPDTKLKLLHLLDILRERTDAEHSLSTHEIIEALAERGIDAARKSVYRDIEVLREAGYEIETRRAPYASYALRTREFEPEEMIWLVDAIQSSPSLTDEMTDALIAKVASLASEHQRDVLARRVDVPGRVKLQNESVFANLDEIQHAMRRHRKVRFHYFTYDENKEKQLRREDYYEVNPVRLVYQQEFYYLITFSEKYDDWVNYRVDRMVDVCVSDEPAARGGKAANYDPGMLESLPFGVFNTDCKPITLTLTNPTRMNAVIDKLGPDVETHVQADGTVRIHARAIDSPLFFGWLFTNADAIRLDSPKKFVREYRDHLRRALELSEEA